MKAKIRTASIESAPGRWRLLVLTMMLLSLLSVMAAHAAPARNDGYVPFWFDPKGRVLIEVPVFDQDVLYYVSAATNPGSVETPFDRGIIVSSVIHFQRSGAKVVVNQINMGFRATQGSAKTQEGVADSFPTSVLAVLPVESEDGGRVVVDATSLFMRDAGEIAAKFKRAKLGDYKFDPSKSVFYPRRMKAFPENTEIETISTFTSDAPGAALSNVTPSPGTFTMRIHHSFLKAPTGYTPRVTQGVAMQAMMTLGGAKDTAPEARDYVLDQLEQLPTI